MGSRFPVASLGGEALSLALGFTLAVGTTVPPTVSIILPSVGVAHALLGDGNVCDCLTNVSVSGVRRASENFPDGFNGFIGNSVVRFESPCQAMSDGRT